MVLLFDRENLPDNVYEIIFATKQQALVAGLLIKEMKQHNGEIGRSLMSFFATQLHEGKLTITLDSYSRDDIELPERKTQISYNKRQFYDRILTPFRSMGFIDFDMYKKVYRLSSNFKKILDQIGDRWIEELKS